MAKILVSVKLELDDRGEGGQTGILHRAIARYLVADTLEPEFRKLGTKELGAIDAARPVGDWYAEVVSAIRVEEGIV